MSQDEALDYLLASGATVAKFTNVGDVHRGKVLGYKLEQVTEMKTKEPKFFASGDPMMQIIFELETDERDPQDPDDTGKRRVFAKGYMLSAVRSAIQVAGHTGSLIGGTLALKYYADGESKNGLNPPKLFEARFKPGDPIAELDDFAGPTDTYTPPEQRSAPPQPAPAGDDSFGDESPFGDDEF